MQCKGTMLAQIFNIPNFKARSFRNQIHRTDTGQLASWKNIAICKGTRAHDKTLEKVLSNGFSLIGSQIDADSVIQEQATRFDQPKGLLEIGCKLLFAYSLEHTNTHDFIKRDTG